MHAADTPNRTALTCEALEERAVPATAALAGGTLTVTGDPGGDRIRIINDGTALRVFDGTAQLGAFAPAAVTNIVVNTGTGDDVVVIDPNVTQPATINGDGGTNKLVAGGGNTGLISGGGQDVLFGGSAGNTFAADGGVNDLYNVKPTDAVVPGTAGRVLAALPPGAGATVSPSAINQPQPVLLASDVDALLRRAAAASASNDAIIVVCDRNGRILGVRVEGGVDPAITGSTANLVFAVDGAYAKALTAAYFANAGAPLTSRTIQFISQSTITQREVDSNPNVTDPNSTVRGPGFVAPVGTGGHFPPNVPFTPQVDLFQIEHTNRDNLASPGPDRIVGTADDIPLAERFNIDPAWVPNSPNGTGPGMRNDLFAPESYGRQSGLMPTAQSRGIATLPGGIPIYKGGQIVGGIGVFFPGKTGYATEENSALSKTHIPGLPDRSLEAEYIAFAAVGGTRFLAPGQSVDLTPVGDLGGVPLPPGFNGLPAGRIDLVGIQLDVFGPGGANNGNIILRLVQATVGQGDPNSGVNEPVGPATVAGPNGDFHVTAAPGGAGDVTLRNGLPVPDGWLVVPHDGNGVTAAEATSIVISALNQAATVRAAIRLPIGARASFVYAVTDLDGNVLALYRQPDATIFSIDVAVAKARNVAYYANPFELQTPDQLVGVPAGFAFTNRTFRYVGQPRFPEAIDGAPPGPMSQLNDDPNNTNRFTGLLQGAPLPASAYQHPVGYDAFNPGTNFHDPFNLLNQNGVVWFPGSTAVYRHAGALAALIGGFGVSGDGVDQDDVTTVAGERGFQAPFLLRADQIVYDYNVRLPYQKFNRNPLG
jgi:uncharacterized protein GlcG (DUF336 family)